MAKNSLVIVESPAKAHTIERFLGSGYKVVSSMGHVKDLPKRKLGVDIENDFTPEYRIIGGKKEIIEDIKEAAQNTDKILLAADPDREGEAICWHLSSELKDINRNIYRILFNEITSSAVKQALNNLQDLDMNRVNAQQARRILDRLVGYKISPLLWKKVRKGLSAGRVQTVALRFVVEREREVEKFKQEEYYLVFGDFRAKEGKFAAQLTKIKNKESKRLTPQQAKQIKDDLSKQEYKVKQVKVRLEKKHAPPPFITSSLQQGAYHLFRFSAKRTMAIAQGLYEGVEVGEEERTGLITYMRTDSFRIAKEAEKKVRNFIKKNYGEEYVPATPPRFKKKKGAQEAHEAIRPTHMELTPDKIKKYLQPVQFKLYSLIYNRFVASQMSPAEIEATKVEVSGGDYIFTAESKKTLFPGYQVLFKKEEKEVCLPALNEGENIDLLKINLEQKFTQPPPRYTEGTLIRKLEEEGIGRPSTYAPTMSVIQDRDYVRKEKGALHPTDLGKAVIGLLVENFPDLFQAQFTSKMESNLDAVEEGKEEWGKLIKDFYQEFSHSVDEAKDKMRNLKKEREKPTTEKCPQCQAFLIIKEGRYGEFISCSNFPKCRYARPIIKKMGLPCPKEDCSGEIIERRNKRGRVFYGCSNYPECKFTSSSLPADKEPADGPTKPQSQAKQQIKV